MNLFMTNWGRTNTSTLRIWWYKHANTLLTFGVTLMAVLALMKIGDEFWRLTRDTSSIGAIDLNFRYREVNDWFTGRSIYNKLTSIYPPASYVMLWPFMGWLDFTQARWLWAATTLLALVWLVYLVLKESGANKPLERAFVALIPLAMNATGSGIGNGQLIVHIIPALLAGLLLLRQGRIKWYVDILAAVFFLMALVKPSVSVPFFWIVLFVPGRLRPGLLVVLGYIALTFFSASFQHAGLPSLIHDWLVLTSAVAMRVSGGYANLNIWLANLGMGELSLPASLLTLVVLGFWTYLHRHVNIWTLLGISAIVSRFWAYHRWYDDLLILIPMVSLFRIAKQGPSANGSDVIAGVLLGITVLAMLVPYRVQNLPPPWCFLFTGGHAIIWIFVLIFLLYRTFQEKHEVFLMNSRS